MFDIKHFLRAYIAPHKSVLNNPYVAGAEGRREWNDRYMNMAIAIRNWQLAFFGALVVVIILAFAVVRIATQSKVQPFVVETNQGMPYAIHSMEKISSEDQRLVNYVINQFITNSRTIVSDTRAEKALLDKVYAYSADNTLLYLRDYYKANNPFNLASQHTVTVNIINSIPLSDHTWQVTWDEVKRQATTGAPMGTTRWMANVTYKFGDVNPKYMIENPFGIYIANVTWSQNQMAIK